MYTQHWIAIHIISRNNGVTNFFARSLKEAGRCRRPLPAERIEFNCGDKYGRLVRWLLRHRKAEQEQQPVSNFPLKPIVRAEFGGHGQGIGQI
jgi:hypothetical protein